MLETTKKKKNLLKEVELFLTKGLYLICYNNLMRLRVKGNSLNIHFLDIEMIVRKIGNVSQLLRELNLEPRSINN